MHIMQIVGHNYSQNAKLNTILIFLIIWNQFKSGINMVHVNTKVYLPS